MNKWMLFLAITFLVVLQAGLLVSLFRDKDVEVHSIGVVGPMSGENSKKGLEMKRGAEMAIAEINDSGFLDGIKLKLHIQDDQSSRNSRYFPLEAAKELVKDDQLLAVVGHFFSAATASAAPVYEKNRIPVVSPTITYPLVTEKSDWIFSIMAPDTLQSTFLAYYVTYALEKKNIAVLHTQRSYEEWQKDIFINTLTLEGNDNILSVPLGRNLNLNLLNPFLERLKNIDIIFFALRSDDAIEVARYLNEQGIKTDFIGGGDIGSDHFIADANVYSEGVYAVNTFLIDLLGEKARAYVKTFRDTYQDAPERTSVHTYEAIYLIAQAIKSAGANPEAIKKFLRSIDTPKKGIESLTGTIFFDKHGAYPRPFFIGQVEGGVFQPAKFQFIPAKYPQTIEIENEDEHIFYFNEYYMKRSTTVFTGISVRNIIEIDIEDSFFKADFLLWFRWNSKAKESFDFTILNCEIEQKEVVEEYFDASTNERYLAFAIEGKIRQEFPLHDYPFDKQTLNLAVKIDDASSEEIILVSDEIDTISLDDKLDLGTWIDAGHIQYVDRESYIYTIKNPLYGKHTLVLDQSLYNYDIKINRKINDYLIKLVPLLIIITVNLLVFFVDIKEHFTPRLAASITSLLSAVAFHMSQSVAHSVGYFVKSDWFFILAYVLICLGISQTVFNSYLVRREGKARLAYRLDKFAVLFYASTIGAILYFIFYF